MVERTDTDAVFKALADPGRRRLLDMLHERAGLTLRELCAGLAMRRQSVSQHLDVLAAANLVTAVRDGRRKLHYLNPVPLHQIRSRWTWKFEEPRLAALDSIKRRAEEDAMTASTTPAGGAGEVPDYVYAIYIRASAEQVWHALTDAERSGRYWGHAQVSEWVVGSPVEHVRTDGSGIADAAGTVLEVDRPRRLAFSFDDPARAEDPTFEPSVVTFELEPYRDIVKLTVTHARLGSPAARASIELGWPTVMSNLKTLLETGDVLPQAPWELHAAKSAEQVARPRP